MPDRASAARTAARRPALSVDVVSLTRHASQLTTLLVRTADARARARWELPWDGMRGDEPLDDAAGRVARSVLGAPPALLEQIAAFGGRQRHPGDARVSVAYLALVAGGATVPIGGGAAWFPVGGLPPMAARQRAMVEAAMNAARMHSDQAPIAFRLLPTTFTLSELQEVYELLLGRRLHKASFRRALQAAWLVEPTDEWRSEGRGRPAQLFRYAPRRRRSTRRGVRFDGLAVERP